MHDAAVVTLLDQGQKSGKVAKACSISVRSGELRLSAEGP